MIRHRGAGARWPGSGNEPGSPLFLRLKETARLLTISPRSLQNMMAAGLPFYEPVPGRRVFWVDEVLNWLKQNKRRPRPQVKDTNKVEIKIIETMKESRKEKARKRATDEVLASITEHLMEDSEKLPHFDNDPARYALCAAVQAAFAARTLAMRKALGQKVKPIGYFISDDEISPEGAVITRDKAGGITIDPHTSR
jgi:hypothetical protein